MPFKVQVGPPQIAIHQGQTVLVSEQDGQINWPSEKGLYFFDTRVVSSWAIYANGETWELLNGGAVSYYAARIFLTNRRHPHARTARSRRARWAWIVSRSISGGMHEDLDITNHGMKPVRFQLEIALRCDFADIFEVKSGRIVRRGRIDDASGPSAHQRLRTTYRNGDFTRAVTISPVQTLVGKGGIRQRPAQLRGGARTRASRGIAVCVYDAGGWRPAFAAPDDCIGHSHKSQPRRDAGGLARTCREDPHQQRGVLPAVSPGARGHGGAPPADRQARITWSSCRPPGCPGSSRRSAATA